MSSHRLHRLLHRRQLRDKVLRRCLRGLDAAREVLGALRRVPPAVARKREEGVCVSQGASHLFLPVLPVLPVLLLLIWLLSSLSLMLSSSSSSSLLLLSLLLLLLLLFLLLLHLGLQHPGQAPLCPARVALADDPVDLDGRLPEAPQPDDLALCCSSGHGQYPERPVPSERPPLVLSRSCLSAARGPALPVVLAVG